MAVELLRGTSTPAALDRLFAGRWLLAAETIPLLDEATVRDSTVGPVGIATVYDADSWYELGTLYLHEPADADDSLPPIVLSLSALALLGLGMISWAVARSAATPRFRQFVFPALAFVAVGAPLGAALAWGTTSLERASLMRARAAASTLRLMPDLDSLAGVPGGIGRVTGAGYLLRDAAGGLSFSSLPSAATDNLAGATIRGIDRVTADNVEYLVADVGSVRIALLPYDQTESPVPAVVVLALLGLLLTALPVTLIGFVDRPRAFFRHVVAWSFLAPAGGHLAIFTLAPLAVAAWLSLHRWSLLDVARPFVGLTNYTRLLGDGAFWNAIRNTAVFTLHVPVSMAIALALALVVQRRARGIVFLRALLFLPTITSLVAVAMVWQWMLHDEYGLLNWLLAKIGIGAVPWLSSPSTALLSIMIMATWMVVGYQMILFQAGLAAIPSDLYDAARIDGANRWRRCYHVTLPGLRHTLFFVLVTSVIGSFQVFGAVYVMTEGGPLHATDVAVFHIYQEAWEYLRFGDAAAQSWVLFAIIFVATWLQFRTLERRLEDQA
jgi:multiple sugar transport system permease protein